MELLEKLLRDEIKARMKTDVVSEMKYSDRIMETLRKYHNRAIETAQVIEELIALAKEMEEDLAQADKLGLNPDEIAFYRALIQNESAVRELGDNNLRELAKYITEQLRKSTSVDWQVRDSVRAKLRNLVRRALRRWKYPPDKADEAIELCLKQAEALSNSWSAQADDAMVGLQEPTLSIKTYRKSSYDESYDDLDALDSEELAMPLFSRSSDSFDFESPIHEEERLEEHEFSIFEATNSFLIDEDKDVSENDKKNDELLKDPRNIPVWFGTNRLPKKINDITKGFGDEWSKDTTLGRCVVNIPEGHVPGSIGSTWWVRLVKGDDRLQILSMESIPENEYWSQLSAAMQEKQEDVRNEEALFFLHGYNVSFEQAAIRTAQLAYDLRIHPAVLFSWPSGGDVEDYAADEAVIEASYDSVAKFVSRLDQCALSTGTILHVMAHSMGNRALLKALEAISIGINGGTKSSIDKLIFAAPDVDARVFMQSLDKIDALDAHKTLYASQKDKAIWLSRVIHQYARAGLMPPVTIVDGVDTIDATGVDDTFLGHSYIASVRALLHDLSSLLKSGLPPSQRVGLESVKTDDGKKYWRSK